MRKRKPWGWLLAGCLVTATTGTPAVAQVPKKARPRDRSQPAPAMLTATADRIIERYMREQREVCGLPLPERPGEAEVGD